MTGARRTHVHCTIYDNVSVLSLSLLPNYTRTSTHGVLTATTMK